MRDEAEGGRDETLRRLVLAALFVFTWVGLGVGVWSFFPYFEREHRRIEPWKAVVVWVADVTALVWFVHYFVSHTLLRKPLRPRRSLGRSWYVSLFGLLLGIGCDLSITVALMVEEKVAYQRAETVQGQVQAVRTKTFGVDVTKYDLECRFIDRTGGQHETRFSLRCRQDVGFAEGTPPALALALRGGRVPRSIPVAYDPKRPERNWIAGVGWDHGDRLHYFSLLVLLFQGLSLPIFILALRSAVPEGGVYPWWYDLHKVFPLLIEAAVFLLFGTLEMSVQALR